MANNILSVNNKAFQFAHTFKGFDFQNKHLIINGCGKFTLNSAKKAVMNVITDDIYNYTFMMFVVVKNYNNVDVVYAVNISDGFNSFEPVMKDTSMYHYRIDKFFTKKDFMEKIKKCSEWCIIAQESSITSAMLKKAHDDAMNNNFKFNRYISTGESYYNFRQNNKKFVINRQLESSIDKSGYMTFDIHTEYKQRARKLRAEREHEKAMAFDCSEKTNEINEKLDVIKKRIAELFDADMLGIVDDVMHKYYNIKRNMARHEIRIEENKYNSVSSIEMFLNDMNDSCNEIMFKIREN